MKKLPKPQIQIVTFEAAAPFWQASEVSFAARGLLSLASNVRIHGGNLYTLCSNEVIERSLGLNHGQLMRIKKKLRDTGLLDYEGNPGDYSHLIERWEKVFAPLKWEYEL